ncbi:MAG: imidazoleglycerol-phosphate dehydratase HisB [Candidatus Omnitrophica bacterium]|nr:imidazoleglycerol-phosphate dehydratase HisB [Candidatus Omnitrophota bacterium]
MKKRKATIKRETSETKIALSLEIDGEGKGKIKSPIGLLNHMLILFAKHGLFNLKIVATGDIEVDQHHLSEDLGICLGEAVKKALGNKKGICRFGFAMLPMDEALVAISIDISGRPFLAYNVPKRRRKGEFDTELLKEFFQGFVNHSGITLHINLLYGENLHHIIEATFKGLARTLDEATKIDQRIKSGIPSTKGRI